MAYADSSIYSLIRPQQPPPDQMKQYAKGLQLKSLVRADREDQAVREAYQQSGGDPTKLRDLLYGAGAYKSAIAAEKAGLEARKMTGEVEKTQLEVLAKKAEAWRNDIASANDDASVAGLREKALRYFGPDAVSKMQLPDRYDPQWQAKAVETGTTLLQGIEKRKDRAVTMRAQNMSVYDPDKGVYVTRPEAGPSRVIVPGSAPSGELPPTGSVPGIMGAPTAVPKDIDAAAATGGSGVYHNVANRAADLFGADLPHPKSEEAAQALINTQVRTRTGMMAAIPGRDSVKMLNMLKELTVSPNSLLQGDKRSEQRFKQTRDMLETEINRIETDILAQSHKFKGKDVSTARTNVSELRNLKNDYDIIINSYSKTAGSAGSVSGFPDRNAIDAELRRRGIIK